MTAFLVIGVIGLALLLVSLVVGDLLDGVVDGLFHSLEWLTGDWFSSAAIGGFVSAFGFGGAIVEGAAGPRPLAVGVGLVAGLAFGWFAMWLTRLLRTGRSDEAPSPRDAVGLDATVVTAIPAEGFGIVRVVLGGHTTQYNARAEQPVEPGTPVHVTGVLSPTAVTVAPVWRELP
ncbi:NfeD family protein [Nocardioides sp. DS6]|uniref:NfeD family protein n=1 Tax=Nocardioides eburneus TaxID=3231482 RepID=A0ABV3SXY0_9ACTN